MKREQYFAIVDAETGAIYVFGSQGIGFNTSYIVFMTEQQVEEIHEMNLSSLSEYAVDHGLKIAEVYQAAADAWIQHNIESAGD